MSVGFWYPLDGQPWHGSGHYSINCDWVPLDISSGTLRKSARGGSGNVSSAFALLLSVVSICMSVFVGYRLFKPKQVPFTPMENLQDSSVYLGLYPRLRLYFQLVLLVLLHFHSHFLLLKSVTFQFLAHLCGCCYFLMYD